MCYLQVLDLLFQTNCYGTHTHKENKCKQHKMKQKKWIELKIENKNDKNINLQRAFHPTRGSYKFG